MAFAVLWSHGSGLELAGVFGTWERVIEVIEEGNPDYANVIRYEMDQALGEDQGGLYGKHIFDDGWLDPEGNSIDGPVTPEEYGL